MPIDSFTCQPVEEAARFHRLWLSFLHCIERPSCEDLWKQRFLEARLREISLIRIGRALLPSLFKRQLERARRRVAMAMALHPRLGQHSQIGWIGVDVLAMIGWSDEPET